MSPTSPRHLPVIPDPARADRARPGHRLAPLLLGIATLSAGAVQAAIITVGTPVGPGQCSFATIQAALDAADVNFGPDTVRITRSVAWNAQNVRLNVKPGEETIVEGGYATCNQAVADATVTTLSGAGGSDDSVFEVRIGTNGIARLRNLLITGGDDVFGSGGGIEYFGNGVLELSNLGVVNNVASRGGGIYAEGTGTDAELVLGDRVTVFSNDAGVAGGGLYVDGLEVTIEGESTLISSNTALNGSQGGYGGGIYITGHGELDGIVRLTTPGAVVTNNEADHGGGFAVLAKTDAFLADADTAYARLFIESSDPATPARVVGNRATVRGGAFYARPDADGGYTADADIALQSGGQISGNSAPVGAAAFLDYDSTLSVPDRGARLVGTALRIFGNRAETAAGTPTDGAILHGASATVFTLERSEITANSGGPVLRIDSDQLGYSVPRISSSLIAGNTTQSYIVHTLDNDGSQVELRDSTIAGNTIGGNAVLRFNADSTLANLIIQQPGKLSLSNAGGTPTISVIVASEGASLGAGPNPNVYVGDPLFVDPDNGDYRVQAASPAVDRASGTDGIDLDGNPRGVDLPVVTDVYGPRDAGAYERQEIGNLVRNAGFANQLRFWATPPGLPDYTSIVEGDSADAGDTRSILVKLDPAALPVGGTLPPDGRVFGVRQCVRIPGAANYLLSAAAKSPGTMVTRDLARANWRYHQNSADCSGLPTREGEFALPSGNAWATSADGQIPVLPGEVGSNSALAITLIAQDGNISAANPIDAYFDAITLTVGDGQPVLPNDIFSDGFENP